MKLNGPGALSKRKIRVLESSGMVLVTGNLKVTGMPLATGELEISGMALVKSQGSVDPPDLNDKNMCPLCPTSPDF